MFFQLFHSHKMHFFRPFYRPKWHISLPFHILQLSKSRNRYPFILPPWLKKGTPFERSLRVQAIIRSPPPPPGRSIHFYFLLQFSLCFVNWSLGALLSPLPWRKSCLEQRVSGSGKILQWLCQTRCRASVAYSTMSRAPKKRNCKLMN